MKKIKIEDLMENGHRLMNQVVIDTVSVLKEAYFVIKIDDLLKERNLTQKDLAQMTGMRVGTISDLVNGKGISLNKLQLFAIMAALRVTSLNDIYEVELPEELENAFNTERMEWTSEKEMPINIKDMYKSHVLKTTGLTE